ncbi:hypothetical protein [Nocardia sp. NPDC051570]|uniref:hypothetical protein n=1 Tax=Nocardia sp. NPDC051570 TaxID=3364324 RepID=UPI0037B7C07E
MTAPDRPQPLTAAATTLAECADRLEELETNLHGAPGVTAQFCSFMTTYAARCRTAAKDFEQIAARLDGGGAGAGWSVPGMQALRQLSEFAVNQLPIPGIRYEAARRGTEPPAQSVTVTDSAEPSARKSATGAKDAQRPTVVRDGSGQRRGRRTT